MKLRSTKLLKAVTFSSLAALTLLLACGDEEDQQPEGTAGTAGSNSTAGKGGASTGGSSAAGSSNGGATTAGKGGMNSMAGSTAAGSGGTPAAGSGGTSGGGGSSAGGAGGDAGGGGIGGDTVGGADPGGSGGDAGGGGDMSNAGAGGSPETAGAGGMGGAPDVSPTNLSIGKTATASTEENNNGAAKAIDGDEATRWCASNGDDGNWITVDLGASHTLTGAEIVWEKGTGTNEPNAKYKYKIELSADNVVWTPTVDQSANVSTEHVQAHAFAADARYVRVTVLDIADPAWLWACAWEVRVLGY